MISLLKQLCAICGTSGNEAAVRDFIISQIDGHCQWSVDKMGNIIACKKGAKTPKNKIMIDAHTDEVGFIITGIDDDGFLKFNCVGGINVSELLANQIVINGNINGVIGVKPIHLTDKENGKKYPEKESLYIDIGAQSKEEAMEKISLGDFGVFKNDFVLNGDIVKAKAIDDRAGCAVLIKLLCSDVPYDFTATFTVQEELGCRGARVATYAVNPDIAIVLEATTAADIAGVSDDKKVCVLGNGPAVSFMDKSTMYDRELYNMAMSSGVKCQPKAFVSGGNNSGAVHLSREGVKTLAISAPCRYLHSASCVANIKDINGMFDLALYMLAQTGDMAL